MAPPDRRVLLHQRLHGRRSHSIFLPVLRIWTVSLADLLYPIRSQGCASDPDKDPVMEKDGRLPPQSNGGRSYRRQKTYQIRSLICESSSPARPAWSVERGECTPGTVHMVVRQRFPVHVGTDG